MSERDAFDNILASLHEASLDDARWPAASGLIDDAIRAEGNSLAFGAGAPDQVQIHYVGCFRRGRPLPERERDYFRAYYSGDERVPRLLRSPVGKLLPPRGLYTDAELKTSATYNEFLPRVRAQKGLNVRLDGPRGTRIVWAVNDPLDANGWSSAQIELIRRLLPHIRQAVSVQQVLAGARALGASLAELLENTGPGDRAAGRARANHGGQRSCQGPAASRRWPLRQEWHVVRPFFGRRHGSAGLAGMCPATLWTAGQQRLHDGGPPGAPAAARVARQPGGLAGDGVPRLAGGGPRTRRGSGPRARASIRIWWRPASA